MGFSKSFPIGALGFAALLVATTATVHAQTSTTGAITGVVTDESTGGPLLLVTVVASSPGLQGTQSEFTDASGEYHISNLPPGTYSLLFVYGDAKVKRENVTVFLDKTTTVVAKINTQATAEVITIKERAPTIDAGSTKQGVTIGQDYLKNIPVFGRSYQGALDAAGGSQGDAFGTSFSGSTSVENNYIVDGMNTSGITLGQFSNNTQGSTVLNNFIQEIEVITGGYNAEFGRSTGGVVNVVTKTGTNEFHGSVWANVQPIQASATGINVVSDSIAAKTDLLYNADFGFDLGGPIIKDKLWFYVGFAPIIGRTRVARIVGHQVDRGINGFNYNQPCGGAGQPICNNDGTTSGDNDPTTTAAVGCEQTGKCESDGKPDINQSSITTGNPSGVPIFEQVEQKDYADSSVAYQMTGKLNFAITPDHQGQISFTATPSSATGVGVSGTPTATQTNSSDLTTDVSAKFTSKFNEGKTQVDAFLGWHHEKISASPVNSVLPDSPTTPVTSVPAYAVDGVSGLTYANLGNVGRNPDQHESDTVLNSCTDSSSTDLFPTIVNCPLSGGYAWQGGFRQNDSEDRVAGKISVTQRVTALGHHQFKAGLDFENNSATITRYDGAGNGSIDTLIDIGVPAWENVSFAKAGPSGQSVCGYDASGNPIMCDVVVGGTPVSSSTFNWGGYIQDSWQILPNLTVNAGLRYEQQYLHYAQNVQDQMLTDPGTGQPLGSTALALKDLIAPRVGVIYDWTREGRSKIYANWGRFYESIPLDLSTRNFGGEQDYINVWSAKAGSGLDAQCGAAPSGDPETTPVLPSLGGNCPNSIGNGQIGTGVASAANPAGATPIQSELLGLGSTTLGVAPGVTFVIPHTHAMYLDEFVAGVEYEVLEDLRLGVSYQNRHLGRIIEDMSPDAAETYIIGNPGDIDPSVFSDLKSQIAGMADGPTKTILENRVRAFNYLNTFDTPQRDYNALQVTFSKRFSRQFMVQGSYTYSILRGNYPGLFSPDTGQLDPNATSQYDLAELLANRHGPLPFDRPHSFKVDGYYTFNLEQAGHITAGVRLRAQSGIPIQTLGDQILYGQGESFILPRGEAGRTDFEANADLHVAYGRKIGNMELELYVELFNVFNNQEQASVDSSYTFSPVNPISGGTSADLPYLTTVPSNGSVILATKNPDYLNTGSRVGPLAGRFGVTLSF